MHVLLLAIKIFWTKIERSAETAKHNEDNTHNFYKTLLVLFSPRI
jgi:hypothetical protein